MIPTPCSRGAFGVLLASYLLAPSVGAQTYLAHGAATVSESSGPLPFACPNPDGTKIATWPTLNGPACGSFGLSTGFPYGGVATDKSTDTVWTSDGFDLTRYDRDGVGLTTLAPPTPSGVVSGLGFDSASGVLWIVDHFTRTAMGIVPPTTPGCPVGVTVVQPPFPVPDLGGFPTGITWDQSTGTLFVCYEDGLVANVVPGGPLGPYGAPIANACGLTTAAGITIDSAATATVGVPVFTVVDRFGATSYQDANGSAAPTTLYSPDACGQLPVGTVDGIAFTARGVRFGVGGDTMGLTPPEIHTLGQSTSPSPGFAVRVSNAPPGSTAVLYASDAGGMICPATFVVGLPLHFVPQPLLNPGFTTVDGTGTGQMVAAIPGGLAIGTEVDAQWLVLAPSSLQVSGGVHLTIVHD